MTKRHPDDPKPTWFRLSAESWARIRAEYLNGATARALAKKYRVSPTSIYRHACQEGWTKEAMAEAVSRKSVADAEREVAEAAAAAKQQHDEMTSLVERIAAEEDATDIAAALERRALAQASAAMVQGRSKEAQALASMAEMMRKRLSETQRRDEAREAREVEEAVAEKRSREAELVGKFRYAAFLAYCMVHNPKGAPAIFVDSIAAVRRDAFGEGDEESIAAARQSALESRRYFGLDEEAWQEAFAATADPQASAAAAMAAAAEADTGDASPAQAAHG
ncbi:MAG: hypothetical protein R3C30_01405 [Hyphomonadaceae bacterium]